MKWLNAAPQPTTFLGLETPWWTLIVAAFSVLVAWRSWASAEKREHHRWLQEKRREAYVTFLSATRDTYDAIEKRGRLAQAPREFEDHPDPQSSELVKDREAIDLHYGKVKRAKDILAVVGPKEMEDLGDRVIARLNLDRIYYSPTGWSQRNENKDSVLRYAEATGNEKFLASMRDAYLHGHAVLESYISAHHEHRLEDFWGAFVKASRRVLGDPKPSPRFRLSGRI